MKHDLLVSSWAVPSIPCSKIALPNSNCYQNNLSTNVTTICSMANEEERGNQTYLAFVCCILLGYLGGKIYSRNDRWS